MIIIIIIDTQERQHALASLAASLAIPQAWSSTKPPALKADWPASSCAPG